MDANFRVLEVEELDVVSGGNIWGWIGGFIAEKVIDHYTNPQTYEDWWDAGGDAVKRGELMPM
jgi:hypothetical protein